MFLWFAMDVWWHLWSTVARRVSLDSLLLLLETSIPMVNQIKAHKGLSSLVKGYVCAWAIAPAQSQAVPTSPGSLVLCLTGHGKLHKFEADLANQVRLKYIKVAKGVLSATLSDIILSY